MRIFDHPAQLLIIVLLVVVLFGAKRLPDAARGLGRSLRIFKTEVKEMKKDDARRPTPAPRTPRRHRSRAASSTRPVRRATEQHRDA